MAELFFKAGITQDGFGISWYEAGSEFLFTDSARRLDCDQCAVFAGRLPVLIALPFIFDVVIAHIRLALLCFSIYNRSENDSMADVDS